MINDDTALSQDIATKRRTEDRNKSREQPLALENGIL